MENVRDDKSAKGESAGIMHSRPPRGEPRFREPPGLEGGQANDNDELWLSVC